MAWSSSISLERSDVEVRGNRSSWVGIAILRRVAGVFVVHKTNPLDRPVLCLGRLWRGSVTLEVFEG